MNNREALCCFNTYEYHKGFYNDVNIIESLNNIEYSDFFKLPDDDDFPYDTAYPLLCGSCNYFALALQKKFGYNPYIIEEIKEKGFHAYCQIYKNGKWYYIDARGITSSFNEFMDIAKIFVKDEYIIRPVSSDDIADWEDDRNYNAEAYAFSEKIIEKFKECYIL